MKIEDVKRITGRYTTADIIEERKKVNIKFSMPLSTDTAAIDDIINELQTIKENMVQAIIYEYPVYYDRNTDMFHLPSFNGLKSRSIRHGRVEEHAKQFVLELICNYREEGKELPSPIKSDDESLQLIPVKVRESEIERDLMSFRMRRA